MLNKLSSGLIMFLFLVACGQPSAPHQSKSGTTFQSNSGTVSSLNAVTGNLELGGSFVSPDSMGSGCYYGGCPAWQFSNYHFSYALADGTQANFTNFSGSADFTHQMDVKVSGAASGNDSTGAAVQVSVNWDWSAVCRSGRGGGCTKRYISGALTVAK
jgi:hypothetical protein